ncbi:hypothetical protein ACRAWD_25295 [Caulobacter segnis]
MLTLGKSLRPTRPRLCLGRAVRRHPRGPQTGDTALFKIVSEQGAAAGVRRIEALTGEAARRFLLDQAGVPGAGRSASSRRRSPRSAPASTP